VSAASDGSGDIPRPLDHATLFHLAQCQIQAPRVLEFYFHQLIDLRLRQGSVRSQGFERRLLRRRADTRAKAVKTNLAHSFDILLLPPLHFCAQGLRGGRRLQAVQHRGRELPLGREPVARLRAVLRGHALDQCEPCSLCTTWPDP
jgi:hypothetical protein